MPTRRVFIRNGAATLITLGFAPGFLARASAASAGTHGKILVAVFQRGAVDGLNMIVPFGEDEYYRARPSIAIPRPGQSAAETAVNLDGFFGLHPRMAALQPLWSNKSLAIVHACGSHDATRSHFDAQDYMESATPGVKSTRDGWLNRCLKASQADHDSPFRGVALTAQMPRALQGSASALAFTAVDRFGIRAGRGGDLAQASFEAEYAAAADLVLKNTGREAFDAIRAMRSADPARYSPANGADYPASPFGQAMRQIAQLVKSRVGLEIAFAESTNWDHHINEGSTQGQIATRLDDFARGLSAFTQDLGDRMADVLVLTMSEFGRAVAENGNRGTDHGHGNAMLVMGGGVRGGKVYGRWPGLKADQRFEGRDLAVTTDFRDVFAEIARGHLGLRNLSGVFPGYTPAGTMGITGS
jgi:uncharacterized protein (DUF1501 family)